MLCRHRVSIIRAVNIIVRHRVGSDLLTNVFIVDVSCLVNVLLTDELINANQRLRVSPYPMISVDNAMKLVLEQATKMSVIEKSLAGPSMLFVC
jgi:hypothetical protein